MTGGGKGVYFAHDIRNAVYKILSIGVNLGMTGRLSISFNDMGT